MEFRSRSIANFRRYFSSGKAFVSHFFAVLKKHFLTIQAKTLKLELIHQHSHTRWTKISIFSCSVIVVECKHGVKNDRYINANVLELAISSVGLAVLLLLLLLFLLLLWNANNNACEYVLCVHLLFRCCRLLSYSAIETHAECYSTCRSVCVYIAILENANSICCTDLNACECDILELIEIIHNGIWSKYTAKVVLCIQCECDASKASTIHKKERTDTHTRKRQQE